MPSKISINTYATTHEKISHPILFVDSNHVIQYLNKPALKRNYEQHGYSNLIGKSQFDCHNAKSMVTDIVLNDNYIVIE